MDKVWSQLKDLALAALLYLQINGEAARALFVLMALDMFIGTAKSIYFGRRFSIKTFFIGYLKKLLLLAAPLTIATMGKGLGIDLKAFVDLTMWVLILNDAASIISSIISIRTGVERENKDFVTHLLAIIGLKIASIYDWLIDQFKKGKMK